ncbi:MAG TPA: hypothetical protein VEY95_14020, partial [Azospirillaceae bacterium]|nr:hypothetical protein [Azospirillaceae bacterium]
MPRQLSNFDAFLRALHRRLVLVRVLEHAGIGALAGCAAAGVLIPLLLWQGRPSLPPVMALLALGTMSGIVRGVARRPSAVAAAMEADRQL